MSIVRDCKCWAMGRVKKIYIYAKSEPNVLQHGGANLLWDLPICSLLCEKFEGRFRKVPFVCVRVCVSVRSHLSVHSSVLIVIKFLPHIRACQCCTDLSQNWYTC